MTNNTSLARRIAALERARSLRRQAAPDLSGWSADELRAAYEQVLNAPADPELERRLADLSVGDLARLCGEIAARPADPPPGRPR